MENNYIPLTSRAILTLRGDDKLTFLQGIITNDIEGLSATNAIYTLILTPQGKFMYELFLSQKGGTIFVDCVASEKDALLLHLKKYKLRSKVVIEDVSEAYEAIALTGNTVFNEDDIENKVGSGKPFCKGTIYIDPRSTALFGRAVIERENEYKSAISHDFTLGNITSYNMTRITNCIADGEHDLQKEKSFPLQFNMQNVNAISFTKGCYVGQEVTTRSHHRGTVKKNIYLLEVISGKIPEKSTSILLNDKKIGILFSSQDNRLLAQLDVDSVNSTNHESILICGEATLKLVDGQKS
jgi:folate-binding protein YgfZ